MEPCAFRCWTRVRPDLAVEVDGPPDKDQRRLKTLRREVIVLRGDEEVVGWAVASWSHTLKFCAGHEAHEPQRVGATAGSARHRDRNG
jgi:hypothetical protein